VVKKVSVQPRRSKI